MLYYLISFNVLGGLLMLYFVPTPIGNKEDITLRALRLLKEVNVLICEDTRTARKLLSMYGVSLQGKTFYTITSFTTKGKLDFYAKLLKENDALVVSEAGTPGLSDPGKSLIKLCNDNSISFSVLPGANALIPSIVAAGFDTTEFTFIGFLPQKKGRQAKLKEIVLSKTPVFFYESVHRIEKLIDELKGINFQGKIFIGREISKVFEQFFTGSLDECEKFIKLGIIIIKGEFVVGISNK